MHLHFIPSNPSINIKLSLFRVHFNSDNENYPEQNYWKYAHECILLLLLCLCTRIISQRRVGMNLSSYWSDLGVARPGIIELFFCLFLLLLLLLLFRRFGVATAADTSCMSLSCKRAVTRLRLTSIVSVAGQTAVYLTGDRCGEMRWDCMAKGADIAEDASFYLALHVVLLTLYFDISSYTYGLKGIRIKSVFVRLRNLYTRCRDKIEGN